MHAADDELNSLRAEVAKLRTQLEEAQSREDVANKELAAFKKEEKKGGIAAFLQCVNICAWIEKSRAAERARLSAEITDKVMARVVPIALKVMSGESSRPR